MLLTELTRAPYYKSIGIEYVKKLMIKVLPILTSILEKYRQYYRRRY